MMTCADARNALLDADLAELHRPSGTPLAAHLAACAECRRLADRVVGTTETLRRERMRRPGRAVDAAAGVARAEADRIRRARRRWLLAAPTLAAAGVAAVLLSRTTIFGPRGAAPAASAAPAAPAASAAPADLPLVASAAHTVAVFKTANPDIVVVWQFPD